MILGHKSRKSNDANDVRIPDEWMHLSTTDIHELKIIPIVSCLIQDLCPSVPKELNTLHTSLSHWAVGFRATLLDGDWSGSQAEEGNQSVPLTGHQKQDPPAASAQHHHQTVEFTGVSLSLESRVILSTSQCTVSVIRHHLIMSMCSIVVLLVFSIIHFFFLI